MSLLDVVDENRITEAFVALAVHGNNASAASSAMKEAGTPVSASTIRTWRRKYPEAWGDVWVRHKDRIEAAAVHQYLELAVKASDVALEAVAKTSKDLKAGKVKDTAKAAQALATTAAIGTDKFLLHTGRPTDIHVSATVEDILRERQREYTQYLTDADGTPVTPVESMEGAR